MLSKEEIHDYLNQKGFKIESDKKSRKYAHEHYLGNNQYLYVKTRSNNFPLIIHPSLHSKKDEIELLNGILVKTRESEWLADKNSSYRNFPTFSTQTSNFGYALNVQTVKDLDQLLDCLYRWNQESSDKGYSVLSSIPKVTLDISPVNLIFYGTPGTGKTWQLQQLQQQYTEQLAQQDHDTFLTEKIRELSWREVICLVFLEEKRLLRVPEILNHPLMRCKVQLANRQENMSQTIWGTLMRHSALDSTTVKYNPDKRSSLALFDKDEAGLWFLLPGARDDIAHLAKLLKIIERGAQAAELIQRYSFVTFHQSYSYEDFVEGLRPVLDDEENSQIRYEIRRGVFAELCERARLDPTHSYALFIDEINRGNVSKIFGELISLIELDKRQGKPNGLEVILPYSHSKFSVPANVSIYATMNTADRSISPIDTALRRRFQFIEMQPDYAWLKQHQTADDLTTLNLSQLLQIMNARIEVLLGRDYLLGHAFFCAIQCFADLQEVMQHKIIPLLQEYFFDDWQKIRLVLNDHRKPVDLQFIQLNHTEQQAMALFGDVPDVPLQTTYNMNTSALTDIQAYQLIC